MSVNFEIENRPQVKVISVKGNILSDLDFEGLSEKIDFFIAEGDSNLIFVCITCR